MTSSNLDKIIVIVGPTASGKSDLGIRLAKKFDGEIISADSRQVYHGMDIGTGKITKQEMYGVPHHLLDVASPKKRFTVAQYQKLAKLAVKKILKKNKLPIIVGGTGQYVDALVNDTLLPAVKPNPKLRKQLEKLTALQLFKQLQKLDSRRANTIDRHNKRRLIRALEIIETTGKPVPNLAQGTPKYNILKIGIKPSDQQLKRLIYKRLLARVKKGMIKEVERIHKNGLSWKRLDGLGLEYRYVSCYLQGLMTKQEMLTKLETEIWHYAKRQMTWFKRDHDIKWISKVNEPTKIVKNFTRPQN